MMQRNNLSKRERKELLQLCSKINSCPPDTRSKVLKTRRREKMRRYYGLLDKLFGGKQDV